MLLFYGKRCRICDRYISQRPKYLNTHIAMHVRKGQAYLVFVDGKQFVVITEKEKAATPSKDVTAVPASAENEPLHNAEVNSAPRI